MKTYSKISILICALLVVVGCQRVIPFDEEVTTPKLVINSLFSTDSIWSVHLSKSLSVLSNEDFDNVDSAIVEIFDENGNLITELLPQDEGVYSADSLSPEPAQAYTIRASAPGFEPVDATDAIPGLVEILNLDTHSVINQDGDVTMEFKLRFKDPQGVANFYMIELWQTIVWQSYYEEKTWSFNAPLYSTDPNIEKVNGRENSYRYILLKDTPFDGEEYELEFSVDGFGETKDYEPKVSLHLISSSEAFYNYRKSYAAYSNVDGNPFAQPVQIYSNVNGGQGIFAGGSRTYWDIQF